MHQKRDFFSSFSAAMVALIFLTHSPMGTQSSGVCSVQESTSSHRFLDNRILPDSKTDSLRSCFELCWKTSECKSMNYRLCDGVCELNDKSHLTHPRYLEKNNGYIYLAVIREPSSQAQKPLKPVEPKYKTCGKLKEMKPSSASGVYQLLVNNVSKAVYCDMDKFGGGWSLVVSISGSNNNHILRTENNCLNSSYCVPLTSGTLTARKHSDSDIRALAEYEGTFRIDVTSTSNGATLYTIFYRLPQGAQAFDAGCSGFGCPKIIISHAYPYQWESNCKGIATGYQIGYHTQPSETPCFRVFDGHDAGECGGSTWKSSKYSQRGERVLYSYCKTTGIYSGKQGVMYVR